MAAFDEALALSLCCGLGSLKEGIGYEKDPDCLGEPAACAQLPDE